MTVLATMKKGAALVDIHQARRLPVVLALSVGALLVAAALAELKQSGGPVTAEAAPGATWPEMATLVLGNFSLSFLTVAVAVMLYGMVVPQGRRRLTAAPRSEAPRGPGGDPRRGRDDHDHPEGGAGTNG